VQDSTTKKRLRAIDRQLFWERQRKAAPAWAVVFALIAMAGWWNWYRDSDRLQRVCDEVTYMTEGGMTGDERARKLNSWCSRWLMPGDEN
jgi:hypothetical protein